MSAKGERTAQGRPFSEQMEGPAGDLPSISDKHTHTEKDYCQLVYFHNVIFVFRKLELSLKEKMGENRAFNTQIFYRQQHTCRAGAGAGAGAGAWVET